jgi:hypothetical protein
MEDAVDLFAEPAARLDHRDAGTPRCVPRRGPMSTADRTDSAAERMRLYRKRRRQGLQYVRIPLRVTEIDDLIRMGLLGEDQRYDAEALQAVALNLVHQALDEARDIWLPRRTRRP